MRKAFLMANKHAKKKDDTNGDSNTDPTTENIDSDNVEAEK